MGLSPLDEVAILLDELAPYLEDPEWLERMGLAADASRVDVAAALIPIVEKAFSGFSEELAAAKARYDGVVEQLRHGGVVCVVAVGNTGELAADLKAAGAKLPVGFTDSVLLNELVIGVGEATGNEVHARSVPTRFVDVVAEPRYRGGTSFAAPEVSGLVADLFEKNPALTPDNIDGLLRSASTDTSAPPEKEGAGVLDTARARELLAGR
jgi:subtilisin family serine protease